MESSDAESIDRQLRYATSQMLRQHYQFDDDDQSTTSEDHTSSRDINRGRTDTPSDSQYINPIRQSPLLPNNEQPLELDVDTPLPHLHEKPHNLLGEVYFNHKINISLQTHTTSRIRSN